MRLVSFIHLEKIRLGAVEGKYIVDLQQAGQLIFGNAQKDRQFNHVFESMMTLLEAGDELWPLLSNIEHQMFTESLEDPKHLIEDGILHPLEEVQLLAPVPHPGKVICVALNYPSVGNRQKPEFPTIFIKPGSTITGPRMPIWLSDITKNVAIEVELGIVINKTTRHINAEKALSAIAGYVLANDIGDRELENRTSQWASGKMFDSFTPIGPWLVTRDEIPSPNQLVMSSTLNGNLVQKGNTSDMFFSCEEIISYLSELTTLRPGDIILTGSPKMLDGKPNPVISLSEGDVISIKIDKLGELTNPVKKE